MHVSYKLNHIHSSNGRFRSVTKYLTQIKHEEESDSNSVKTIEPVIFEDLKRAISTTDIQSLSTILNGFQNFFAQKGKINIDFFLQQDFFSDLCFCFINFPQFGESIISMIDRIIGQTPETNEFFLNESFGLLPFLKSIIIDFTEPTVTNGNIPRSRFIYNIVLFLDLSTLQFHLIYTIYQQAFLPIFANFLYSNIQEKYENGDGSETDDIKIEQVMIDILNNFLLSPNLVHPQEEIDIINLYLRIIEVPKRHLYNIIIDFFDIYTTKFKEKINLFIELKVYNRVYETMLLFEEGDEDETITLIEDEDCNLRPAFELFINSIYCSDEQNRALIAQIIDIESTLLYLRRNGSSLTEQTYRELYGSALIMINNKIASDEALYDFNIEVFAEISEWIMDDGTLSLKEDLIKLMITIMEKANIDQLNEFVKLSAVPDLFVSLQCGDTELMKDCLDLIDKILSTFGKFGAENQSEEYRILTTQIFPDFLEKSLGYYEDLDPKIEGILNAYYPNTEEVVIY